MVKDNKHLLSDTTSGSTPKPKLYSHYAQLESVTFHFMSNVSDIKRRSDPPNKKPLLLFLHGFPEFWYAFKFQLDYFYNAYTVVAVDLKGFNLSSKPDSSSAYHVDTLTDELSEFITYLGYRKTTLVGHDWGGSVAWHMAIHSPDRVKHLITLCSPHPQLFKRELLHNAQQRARSAYIALLRSPAAEAALSENEYAYLLNALSSPNNAAALTEDEKQLYRHAWSKKGALNAMLNYYRAIKLDSTADDSIDNSTSDSINNNHAHAQLNQSAKQNSKKVAVPTLVLWGDKDPYLLPECLDGLDGVIADNYLGSLQVKRFQSGSHWLLREYPEEISKAIEVFITER